jgi:recombination protein RecA
MISRGVVRARHLSSNQTRSSDEPCWDISEIAGRICELQPGPLHDTASSALLTAAVRLIAQTQLLGDPAAWVTAGPHIFFPPDLTANGVDLDAVVVVRLTDARAAAQAADQLVRSGAFGIVIIDLIGIPTVIPDAMIGRLSGLARTHNTAVLFLCDRNDQSRLGSMVSLRGYAYSRAGSNGRYSMEISVDKDKSRGKPWHWTESGNGPPGLP